MALCFPDLYELGMSNFGLKILYQLVNNLDGYMVDRVYAPAADLESLLRERSVPLFAFESKEPVANFDLVGFSLQYELTYTNVLNMLDLSGMAVKSADRASTSIFPLVFGGGPSAVNPEPMAHFLDFFIIGDGEEAIPHVMKLIDRFKQALSTAGLPDDSQSDLIEALKTLLLLDLACNVPGVYAPVFYRESETRPLPLTLDEVAAKVQEIESLLGLERAAAFAAIFSDVRSGQLPERVHRQVCPLNDQNQPTSNLVPYLALVHDRETLEVRRGCDRGCRFCQPGYTFLPVRERSTEDLVKLSKQALQNSGHEEYSLLSLCVSDYTSLQESVRALNREHSSNRTSLSFPSQRADRMNLDVAEELKVVRKSGITLAPEAGTEKMRRVINKGLSHQQILDAIEASYKGGWQSVKLYFMCCLPFEEDDDLRGIIDLLKEATHHCNLIKQTDPARYKRRIDFTCTISNFVPKPFTPFQWFGQISPEETLRKHKVLRDYLKASRLNNIKLNVTNPQISLLEAVVSRGGRIIGDLIYKAWCAGAKFDAWEEQYNPETWHKAAAELGFSLEQEACTDREPGSYQPYDVVHIGLHHWWLQREWEKAVKEVETAPCTENTCHACGICTELDTHHVLAAPQAVAVKRNPFVKELNANQKDQDSHPSLFILKRQKSDQLQEQANTDAVSKTKLRFVFRKVGDLRFVGHLDLQNLFTRAARRAMLPMIYTQGFNPQPKLHFACPLPIFQQGVQEVGEIELYGEHTPADFMERINAQMPFEVQVLRAFIVPAPVQGLKEQSLPAMVGWATYRASLAEPLVLRAAQESLQDYQQILEKAEKVVADLAQSIDATLMAEAVTITKEDKTKEIRSLIKSLRLDEQTASGLPSVSFTIATGSQGHLKPNDLLDHLTNASQGRPLNWQIERLELLAHDGKSLLYTAPDFQPESTNQLSLSKGS